MVKKIKVVDNYHGTKVYDPYRWLEDIHSEDTKTFIQEHNKKTKDYIEEYEGFNSIKNRLTELWTFDSYSCPIKKGDYYYFSYNNGTKNQPCLYRAKSLQGERQLLVDPNLYAEDGTAAIGTISINSQKDILAYSISQKGSDWQVIKLLDMSSMNYLKDEINWCKFTDISWMPDKESFIYSRYPNPDSILEEDLSYHNMVCIHRLGTSQEEDTILIDGKEKSSYSNHMSLTEDTKYVTLVRHIGTSSENLFLVKKVEDTEFFNPFEGKEASWEFIGNNANKFYFLTNYKAPKRRILEVDINNFQENNWRELVKEQELDTISFAIYTKGYIVMAVMHHASHKLAIYNTFSKEIYDYDMPTLGAISEISKGEEGKEIFFMFSSYFVPNTIYKFDLETNLHSKVLEANIDFDFYNYETKQVFVTSKDGTKIPMFINHKKGIKLDGNNPTVLYAYGGFNLNRIPEFRIPEIVWMERGGVFAVANIRGGNEYGEKWHEEAMLDKKQNCFDDFISCGEWLIENNYTSKKKLAIRGRSNGGLLTAACMVQRPDLYGAVISQVGVLDMLRYHKYTIGRFWIPEYGDAETNEDHFKFLFKYSPLHNIRCGVVYPPILVPTGDSDDRVLPCHSYKFVATLEEASSGENPILLRVEKNAGHGHGKPVSKLIEVEAYIYSFLEKVLK